MQEGIFALMQMAKTSAALSRLHDRRVVYISVLTNPTTGGVSASFAMLGDINIGEPGALIGFAGPRVIEQTIGQTLPAGFQRSEFLLEHGLLDMVVARKNLKAILSALLRFHWEEGGMTDPETQLKELLAKIEDLKGFSREQGIELDQEVAALEKKAEALRKAVFQPQRLAKTPAGPEQQTASSPGLFSVTLTDFIPSTVTGVSR